MEIIQQLGEAMVIAIFDNEDITLTFQEDAFESVKRLLQMARDRDICIPDTEDRFFLNLSVNKEMFLPSRNIVVIRLVGSIDEWEIGGTKHRKLIEAVSQGLRRVANIARSSE